MYVTFDTSVYKSAHSSTYLVSIKMLCVLIAIGILGSVGNSKPLLAGQPGGPWNTEEIDIVRQKVLQIMPAIISRGLYILNPFI